MRLLDRHIAGRYLLNVVTLFVILFSFVIVVDAFLNLREFIIAAEEMRPNAGALETLLVTALAVVDLWGPRLLQLFNYMIGVVLVAALGFTCAQMVRRREFIAMLASGMSLRRLAAPVLVVATLVTVVGALNQEFLLPRVAHLLPRSPEEAGKRELDAFPVRLVRDASNRQFYAADYQPREQRMLSLSVWERDERGRVLRRIWADEATWDGSGWALVGGEAERLDRPGQLEPVAHIETDLDPTALLVHKVRGYGEALSWRQISASIEDAERIDPSLRDRFDRIRFGRISMAIGGLLAVVLAMPFFFVRMPQNMVRQSLRCAPLAAAALAGSVLGSAAPLPGLPVIVGVFVPVIVLAPLAVWALAGIRS